MTTADLLGAQAHARAMAARTVVAMPTIPPPDGMVWDETIGAGGYASRVIARGTTVTFTDLAGDACASLLLFNADNRVERLNVADTMKVQWNAYLAQGRLILSDMGRVLATIIEDTAGTHDCFCGVSSALANAQRYGDGGNHSAFPDGRSRFRLALARHGLGRKDLHPCINLFKGVRITDDGATIAEIGPFAPERRVVLRAEMNLLVVVANCPHPLDPRSSYSVTPLRLSACEGLPTTDDDPIRSATPEGLRAYLNTEDFFRQQT
jgi:uncharacterized protein